VFCGDCGLMFMTRAVQQGRPTAPAVPRPVPAPAATAPAVAAPPRPGGWFGTPAARPQPAPASPPPAASSNDEEEVLPFWDDAQVSALLAGGASPAASPSAPSAAAAPAVARPQSRPLPQVNLGRLDIGAATSVGRQRQRNEDSYLLHRLSWANKNLGREIALCIVADGLGGHNAGDVASGMAITGMSNALAPLLTSAVNGQPGQVTAASLTQSIDSAIKSANLAIFNRAQGDSSLRGMASTAAVVITWDSQVVIGHVGDCRAYHWRAGNLSQITKDQTLVSKMVEMGRLTPQEALNHPARNEVSQAIGLHREIEPVPYQLRLSPGDWLIIACDGLHAHVDAKNLEQTLRTAIPAAAYVANNLVETANQGGGSDNCTVIAIRCYCANP
jgi:protein phosphatase